MGTLLTTRPRSAEPASATYFPVGSSAVGAAPHPTFAYYYHSQEMQQQLNQQFQAWSYIQIVAFVDNQRLISIPPYQLKQYYADPATDVFMKPRPTS